MSGTLGALGGIVSQAYPTVVQQTGLASALAFIRQPRSIGTIIPDVTIEESFSDRMEVTTHPIATGTPVSDHAFLLPKEVVMRCGWSNSSTVASVVQGFASGLAAGGIGNALTGAGGGLLSSFTEQRATDIYNQLLALQASREPFQLTAGKRTYKSMVITELSVTNTAATEYALILECRMQEVILISVSGTPTASAQASPQQTQSTTDNGTSQPQQQDNRTDLLKQVQKFFPSFQGFQ